VTLGEVWCEFFEYRIGGVGVATIFDDFDIVGFHGVDGVFACSFDDDVVTSIEDGYHFVVLGDVFGIVMSV